MAQQFEITEIIVESHAPPDAAPTENAVGLWICNKCDYGGCPSEHFTVSVDGKPHSDYDNFKCPQCGHEWQIISPEHHFHINL